MAFPLDNTYPIGFIYNIKLANSSVYLSAMDIGIVRYSKYGQNPQKIGSLGRGPGEYTYCLSFAIDEKNENVYVMDKGNVVKVYSKNGSFLRNIRLNDFVTDFEKIEYFDSKLFITAYSLGQERYDWIVLDTIGNLLRTKVNPIPLFITNSGAWEGTYKFGNKIY